MRTLAAWMVRDLFKLGEAFNYQLKGLGMLGTTPNVRLNVVAIVREQQAIAVALSPFVRSAPMVKHTYVINY